MKIYLDMVFLVNFIIDFFILYGVKKVLKINISIKRIILGALVGSLSSLLLFISLNNISLFLCKILFSFIMIIISFGRRIFKNLLYFYLLSIILGGTFYLFDIGTFYNEKGILLVKSDYFINFFVLVIGSPLIIYLFIKENIKYKNTYSNKYLVRIILDGLEYNLEGVLDTGNRLIDPYKKRSVLLVNILINIENFKVIYVPYEALNFKGVIPCVLPDKIFVDDKEFNNCLIGFSKEKFKIDGVDCILPNKFKEDL